MTAAALASGKLTIPTADVFTSLYQPARYKAAWGGRGSGKSHDRAGALIDDSLYERGLLSVCIREVQKSLKDSAKRLLEAKLSEFRLGEADGFRVYTDRIQTPGDGVIIFQGMQDHTAESIKSLEGFKRAWAEEAQTLSSNSLQLLRPTIRAPGSELWFTWNPRRKIDPVDQMFRGETQPTGAQVVKANWDDNPWFPDELEQERMDCLRDNPDQYDHIWEGGYVSIASGAYFARQLVEARAEGRICSVAFDPMMTIRLFCDIGGTGAQADAFSIWPAQFIGDEIRTRDYYEAVGQPLSAHLAWLARMGWGPGKAQFWLPHDGASHDKVYAVSYESALRTAGYQVTVVPNQGRGAAAARVEVARKLFPKIRFDEGTTEAGRDALGWYHEKRDDKRAIGLGPEHDWSSHACFTADTLVLTRYGMRRIDSLSETGEVLTPCGWKHYILPRIAKRAASLVEVAFVGGHTVRCTPDHLFLTASGWKSAESLETGSLIQSSLTFSRSISMAVSIACGRAKTITLGAARSFTDTFGRMLSGPSPRIAISTTGTAIPLTTLWPTSNAWTGASIYRKLGIRPSTSGQSGSATQRGTPPPSGIVPRLDGFGTSDMLSGQRVGQSGSASLASASIAARRSIASSAPMAINRNIAALTARLRPIASAAKQMIMPLRIARVRRLNETADVWDITVPDTQCFSLSNGAVVHNSDAFGLMCVAHNPPRMHRLALAGI